MGRWVNQDYREEVDGGEGWCQTGEYCFHAVLSLSLSLTSSGCMQEVTDHSSPSSAGGGPPPLPELPSANILDTSFRKSWEES